MSEPTPAELNESAMNHFSRGNGVAAARQLQWALIGDPLYAEAWHNRAEVLRALNDPFDAILCVDKAIDLDHDCAAYWNTRGVCFAEMSQFGDAERNFRQALDYDKSLASAWINLSMISRMAGDYPGAVYQARAAALLKPDNADYHVNLAGALLRAGSLKDGWDEYEWRFKTSDAFHRNMPLPEWDGLSGVSGVVLYAEQGFGDAIQFLRFAPMLKSLWPYTRIYVEVKKPLTHLARTMTGIDGVITYGEPLPPHVTHCLPIMSAARACGIERETDLPDCVPYFHPATTQMAGLGSHLKIGLCWQSGVRPYQPELAAFAASKSVEPHFLRPLSEIKGVHWVNLQIPTPANELMPFSGITCAGDLFDFYDTAQLMKNLDLVVSVDTSVAHLSGALGIDTLLMSPFDNCWRWRGDSFTSYWYPSLRQYRQKSPGDWPSVIERVKSHIESQVKNKQAA